MASAGQEAGPSAGGSLAGGPLAGGPAGGPPVGGHSALSQLVTQLHLLGGSASRAELTERLGCGRSVMGYLLGDLVSRGVVTVDQAAAPPAGSAGSPASRPTAGSARAGRPSHQVSVAATAPVAIGVHLEIDTATVATFALGGRIVDRAVVALRPSLSVEELLGQLAAAVSAQARSQQRVLAAGMAVPSPVRRSDGLAFAVLHLGWINIPFRERLAQLLDKQLGGIPLMLGNDANLAALAEHRHGAGTGARQLLYLTTGRVGLGGALISNGRLFDGAHGYAMEPGHITVDPAGAPCACGSTGCLEVECDHRALLRAAGAAPGTDDAARAAALLSAAATGDDAALRAVRHVTARLGSGLASLINLTDPDRVVLAGSLARYAELAPDTLSASLASRSFLNHADPVTIRAADIADAPLLGAADLAFQPLLDDPRAVLDQLRT
jgi:predicted NBD/HSP70 family sugar kinase